MTNHLKRLADLVGALERIGFDGAADAQWALLEIGRLRDRVAALEASNAFARPKSNDFESLFGDVFGKRK
jgi:hypothetical protein